MAMPSLFEDCQAWIDKGQESWKSYFSKWETFAKYEEETLRESELVHKLNDKCEEERNGNKKMQKLLFSEKKQKVAFFKSRPSRPKNHNKNKKIYQKTKAEMKNQMPCGSFGNKSLSAIIENKQLEITLTTVFSDFLKTNTNMTELFTVLFQTFSGREMTIKDSDYSFPKQQVLSLGGFEMNVASPSFENEQVLSLLPVPKSSLNHRSICPDRNLYLQSCNKNRKEIDSKQMQRKWGQWGQWGSPMIKAEDSNGFGTSNFSKHQFLTSNFCLTPLPVQNLEMKNCPTLKPIKFRLKNTGFISAQFGTSHKFPSSFCQNKEQLRQITISEMSKTQEGKRLGNLCLQQRTNGISLRKDNTHCIIPQRKTSEQKCLNKMLLQRRHPSKKLIFDSKEDDSDSDHQTEHHTPLIHCQNKRQRADELSLDAAEPDTDDCRYIFDRIVKS